jgi:hypothetical protein
LGGVRVVSGTWKISEDSDNQKWIECVTAGVASTPMTQAFGTWEFDFCFKRRTDSSFINLLSTFRGARNNVNNSGYSFYASTSNWIELARITAGAGTALTRTSADYITEETKYTLRITRSNLGVFTTYIKGGAFTKWTQLVTDSGSNQ